MQNYSKNRVFKEKLNEDVQIVEEIKEISTVDVQPYKALMIFIISDFY